MKRRRFIDIDPRELIVPRWNPRKMRSSARARLRRLLLVNGYLGGVAIMAETKEVVGGNQRTSLIVEMLEDTEGARTFTFEGEVYNRVRLVALGFLPMRVCELSGYTRDEALALCVGLNNPETQGDYDWKILTDVLSTIDAEGGDATLTGFDDVQLAGILARAPGMQTAVTIDDDAAIGARPYTKQSCPACGHTWVRSS